MADAAKAERRGHFAHRWLDHTTSGSMALGNAEDVEQLRVPLALHDVVEQRARSIGHIGHVAMAAGQVPDEPAVDGAEGQLAALGAVARALHVIEDPLDLGGGKIGIEHQAGLRRDCFAGTALFKFLAQRSGAAVLPHNGGMNRLAGGAIPHDHGLALIGDADGGHVARPRAWLWPALPRHSSSGW